MKNDNYIPALRFESLTTFYDPIVRLTTREKTFKKSLIEQSELKAYQQILDLGCGTATMTILIKQNEPSAKVFGLDGDAKILIMTRQKIEKLGLEIQLDEGMSYKMPYANATFDRVLSSLFFHHLTRENKLKTLREVFRVLKPNGELHIADWGLPSSFLMNIASSGIQLLDGKETTDDNFKGNLPAIVKESGFTKVEEKTHFNSLFGTIRLLKGEKKI